MSGIKHAYATPKPDGADSTKVSATKWNDPHTIDPGTFLQGSPDYGLGIDGTLALDGATTVLGMVPSGAKVYTLTRDVHATSITFTGGATLFLANWRLFCTGAITGQGSGTTKIHNDGNSAVGAAAGTATAAGFYAATLAGGVGVSAGTGVGTAGANNAFAPTIYATTAGAAGGTGTGTSSSDGGNGTTYSCAGGGGGVQTNVGHGGEAGGAAGNVAPLAASHGYGPHELETGKDVLGGSGYQHGSGGGGGASFTIGGTGNAIGGGGGASAGKAWVAAQSIVGVTVSARGGNGANGARPTGPGADGAGAGGGGGPGGEVIVKYSTCSDLTCDVTGGIGGIGDAIGSGYIGRNGGTGFKGRVFAYNLAGDGTAPTVVP